MWGREGGLGSLRGSERETVSMVRGVDGGHQHSPGRMLLWDPRTELVGPILQPLTCQPRMSILTPMRLLHIMHLGPEEADEQGTGEPSRCPLPPSIPSGM